MEYMRTKEAAERCGYPQATIARWCRKGIIKAEQDSYRSPWRIPIDTKCPKKTKIKWEE